MAPPDAFDQPQQSKDANQNYQSGAAELDFVSLLSSYKPAADISVDPRFPTCSVGAMQAGRNGDGKGDNSQKDEDGTKTKEAANDPKEQPPAPAQPMQAPRPGPRPGRPVERPPQPWEKPGEEPAGKPEDRLEKLDKELGKNLDPNLDKYIKQLDSNSFSERQEASRNLERLLKEGGAAALAHCARAQADSKNPEMRKRLDELIVPYVNQELSSPTFAHWLQDQKGNYDHTAKTKGIPEIIKDSTKTPEERAERQQKLEVLSAYLGKSGQAAEINTRLGEYKYSKEIADELKPIQGLQLDSVGDAELAAISKLAPNLESLTLTDSPNLTEKGLGSLKNLGELNSLRLNEVKLNEKALTEISALPNLKGLSIQLGQLTDGGLKALANCQNLEHLDITDNPNVTDAGLKSLQGIQSLRSLTLDRTGITDKFLDQLNLQNLDFLSIKGTRVGTDGLDPQKLAQNLPGITQIAVGDQIPQDKLNRLQKQLAPGIRVIRDASY